MLGVVLAFALIRFTVDDAFISWRYGQSLPDGAWDSSGTYPVEAYSDPIHTALSVVPAAFGLIPECSFKLVGPGVLTVTLAAGITCVLGVVLWAWGSCALVYAPGYWLRVYAKPGLGRVAAQRLADGWQSADLPDNEPSSTLLSQHLFDFPFLHG